MPRIRTIIAAIIAASRSTVIESDGWLMIVAPSGRADFRIPYRCISL